MSRFAYVFVQPAGSLYPPILDLRPIDGPFAIDGAGGPIPFRPFRVQHGRIDALGFRINDFAYLPDVSAIPDATWPELEGLDTFVLDALRRKPHPTHAHLAQSLEWLARAAPRRGVLTNMHNDLDYADAHRRAARRTSSPPTTASSSRSRRDRRDPPRRHPGLPGHRRRLRRHPRRRLLVLAPSTASWSSPRPSPSPACSSGRWPTSTSAPSSTRGCSSPSTSAPSSAFALGILGARKLFHHRPGEAVAIGFGALFSNSVLLGLPIMERAYGAAALGPTFAIVSIHAPFCYFLGITVMEFARADGRSLPDTAPRSSPAPSSATA